MCLPWQQMPCFETSWQVSGHPSPPLPAEPPPSELLAGRPSDLGRPASSTYDDHAAAPQPFAPAAPPPQHLGRGGPVRGGRARVPSPTKRIDALPQPSTLDPSHADLSGTVWPVTAGRGGARPRLSSFSSAPAPLASPVRLPTTPTYASLAPRAAASPPPPAASPRWLAPHHAAPPAQRQPEILPLQTGYASPPLRSPGTLRTPPSDFLLPDEQPRIHAPSAVRTPVTIATASKTTAYDRFRAEPDPFRVPATGETAVQQTTIDTYNPELYIDPGGPLPIGQGRGRPTVGLDPHTATLGAINARQPVRPSRDLNRDRSPAKGATPTQVPQNIYDREWHRDRHSDWHTGRMPWYSAHVMEERDHRGGLGGYYAPFNPRPYAHPVPEMPALEPMLEQIRHAGHEARRDRGDQTNMVSVAKQAAEQHRRLKSGGAYEGGGLRDKLTSVDELIDGLQLRHVEDGDGVARPVVTGGFLTTAVARPPFEIDSELSSEYGPEYEVEEDLITARQYHQELMIFREQMKYYRSHHPEDYPRYLADVIDAGLPREHHEYFRREMDEILRNSGEVPEFTALKARETKRRAYEAAHPVPCDDPSCRHRFRSRADAVAHVASAHPELARQAKGKKKPGVGAGGGRFPPTSPEKNDPRPKKPKKKPAKKSSEITGFL
eukprot:Rhum_TRINITY_DN5753_c0_g2::Rhum_TRINITY_DN5753_c0_g2_i1::g.18262::m.18262